MTVILGQVVEPSQLECLETRIIVLKFWQHRLWLHQAHKYMQFHQVGCWATEQISMPDTCTL